ncbi:hypothetical protein [Yinghuangia soli]|uniref:LPXTG cell wall anchor domain-containing protein n=1 Tax=Yinghuangia soli TaxID=2908204 RepID=A0AA41Q5A4_9ACTN|nr:hypothetical protein [Yinghuangia soli]MCF2531828.1 hypothetical protein [Yinghuangia soli]
MRRSCTYVLGASSAIALLALAPTAAHAQGAEVFPGSGSPGTKVTVNDGNLCAGTAASATSEAFGTITLSKGTQTMVGSGTVKEVPNGSYGVKLTCGNGKSASGSFSVTGSTSTKPTTPTTKPTGGVKAGSGGTAETETAGLSAGGALLLGGGAFAVYALRRRSSSSPTA